MTTDKTDKPIPFLIRFEPELHAKLKEEARKSRMSMNQYCLDVLSKQVGFNL